MSDLFDLGGKVCIVAGAASGLGERFAVALAEHRANVVCCARRKDRIEAVAQRINEGGGSAIALPLDVTDGDSYSAFFGAVESEFGLVDVLINNAGISGTGSTLNADREGWDRTLAVNLTASFDLSRIVARKLVAAGKRGSIINISSILGIGANTDADYSVSKAALLQLTRSMALDFAPYNIRANTIVPGFFFSEMTDGAIEGDFRDNLIQQIPLHRFGRPEELDGLIVLLASDASSFMTGATIVVDGGQTCQVAGVVRSADD
jgi:NAD(P)-dependent dehydrogenase (short-subunit alcohol dehydrogenase family)